MCIRNNKTKDNCFHMLTLSRSFSLFFYRGIQPACTNHLVRLFIITRSTNYKFLCGVKFRVMSFTEKWKNFTNVKIKGQTNANQAQGQLRDYQTNRLSIHSFS